jgi:TIR domain
MTNDRPLKCFLSYGPVQQAEVDAIVNLLQLLDVDIFTAHDIEPGQAFSSTILSALRAADFVCVILSDAPLSANIAFEAGLAIGLGKAVLALSQGTGVPFDIGHGVQVLRLKAGDPSSVAPDIRRFVRHVKPRPVPSPTVTSSNHASVETAAAELNRLRTTNAPGRERALVDVVAHLFNEPGLEVMREEPIPNGQRPDLLLWSDPLVAELGGPLIIECKYYRGGSGNVVANARHALRQLQSYIEHSSAGLGLLVFDHDRPRELKLSQYDSPKALAFFVGDLIDTVRAGKLTDEIWRRRARAARLKEPPGDAG